MKNDEDKIARGKIKKNKGEFTTRILKALEDKKKMKQKSEETRKVIKNFKNKKIIRNQKKKKNEVQKQNEEEKDGDDSTLISLKVIRFRGSRFCQRNFDCHNKFPLNDLNNSST